MKKNCFLGVCLILFCAGLNAADVDVYTATVSQVDSSSPTFNYKSFEDVGGTVSAMIDQTANETASTEKRMALAILKSFVNRLNLDLIQSMAISSKAIDETCYESLAFICIDRNGPGDLLNVVGTDNKKFANFDIVPENAVIAFSAHGNLDQVYRVIYQDLMQASPDMEVAMQFFEMQAGISLAAFTKAVSGEYIGFSIVDSKNNELQSLLRIPDERGNLAGLLQGMFMTGTNVIKLSAVDSTKFGEEIIVLEKGAVILASNMEIYNAACNARNSKKNITSSPIYQKYNRNMSNMGIIKLFISLDENAIKVMSAETKNRQIGYSEPFSLVSEVYFTGNGYKITCVGDKDLCERVNIMKIQALLLGNL